MTGRHGLTGTGALLHLAVRRDRVMVPAWVLVMTLVVTTSAASIGSYYDTVASRLALAASIDTNTSLRALYGPVHEASTIGGLTAWRMLTFGAALTGLMGLLLVVRHTRDEEETGRLELVGSGAVGRRAPLTAALLTAFGASLAVALFLALGLAVQGEEVAGSLALGLSFAAAGCLFAAVGAVAAQLATTGREARGIASAVLGMSFLLRAAGDAAGEKGPGWLVWLSPLGWVENLRPFADERWWVLALTGAAAAALAGTAYALVARRDLDAGMLPARPGPARAGAGLSGPFGLARRLQRGTLAGWTAAYAVAGLVLGATAEGAADLVEENPKVADVVREMGGPQSLTDAFLAAMLGLLGMVAGAYAVQAVLRLHGEETGGRADPVLACAVGRLRWAAGHLVFAAFGTVVLMLVGGAAMGAGHGVVAGDITGRAVSTAGSALVQLPAVWLVGGIALMLFGLWPRISAVGWGLLTAFVVIGLYGPVLHLDQWAMDLSPFTHLPKVPGEEVTAVPLAALTALGTVLGAAGLTGLRRRDLG
ncbi:ABC transporter permease [Streptomyces sp. SCUT-3]|uniref:ABC transporter permease n=1 Tax=Streptomyces sp. SCUT-3 TaxID=2684469 RepID=UPI0015FC0156|nr:ABC transporter permease [Streptomyces sp. SCUT-3]